MGAVSEIGVVSKRDLHLMTLSTFLSLRMYIIFSFIVSIILDIESLPESLEIICVNESEPSTTQVQNHFIRTLVCYH